MKLYDGGRVPNSRRVRVFLAEKGIAPPELVALDVVKLEHKTDTFAAVNPWQGVPALVLDDGTVICESIAVCRYFEELHPEPALFGTGAVGRAVVEMWNRRAEIGLFAAIAAAFRHLHPAMAPLEVPQVPAWGEANRPKVVDELRRLDARLADSPFLAGEAVSVADITAGIAVDFMKPARLALPDDVAHVRRWHAALTARPSWAA